MNYHYQSTRILVTGMSGSGKTTYMFHRFATFDAPHKFCFDWKNELTDKSKLVQSNSQLVMEENARRNYPVVYDPSEMFGSDFAQGYQYFMQWVYDISTKLVGPKIVMVDEIWKFVPPGAGKVDKGTLDVVNLGRKHELNCIFSAQRPNKVNSSIRGEVSELVVFKQVDKSPLKWLEEDDFDPEQVKQLKFPGGHIVKKFN